MVRFHFLAINIPASLFSHFPVIHLPVSKLIEILRAEVDKAAGI
jgi:hypothetical protein